MAAASTNAIEVRSLVKRYGDQVAVDHLDLDIRRGEFLSLLGPNGAGKSTTIRVLTTLLPPTEGSVVISGYRMPGDNDRIKPLLGLVPQEIALYDMLSARDNVRFFARLYGLGGRPLEARVSDVLNRVGLLDRADSAVRTFSGGMQRRVNIAAALVHDPEILFLDEPTVGLDPVSRNAIWDILRDLKARGKTIVLTTHYMDEAEALSDRVAIVDRGRVIAQGTPAELIQQTGVRTVLQLTVAGDPSACRLPLQSLPEVKDISVREERLLVATEAGSRLLPQILQILVNAGIEVRTVEVVTPNLGTVFLHFTGRELRD